MAMAPLAVAAIVATGLFGTGTVIKPQEPVLGTVLQVAGVGALVGGGIGAAAGVPSGLATTLGTKTLAATVGTSALIGGAAGGVIGAAVAGQQVRGYRPEGN